MMDESYMTQKAVIGGLARSANNGPVTMPHLGDIAAYADRIEKACEQVAQFNDRFRSLPQLACDAKDAPSVPGYSAQMVRLDDAIGRLERAVSRLSDIG